MDNLWEKINYIKKDKKLYLDTNIYEYDLSKANINALYCSDMISLNEYNALLTMDKYDREVYIGRRIQSENKLYKKSDTYLTISSNIKEAKRRLFESNNIDSNKVIRIANDAIYVEEQMEYRNTSFDLNNNGRYMTFHINRYNSLLALHNYTILIFFGILDDGNYNVEVKGVNDKSLEYNSAFLEFICDILMYLQKTDPKITLMKFQEFHNKYINRQLPIEYYMEFVNTQAYRIDQGVNHVFTWGITNKSKYLNIDNIDIEFNYNILRELYSIIIELNR